MSSADREAFREVQRLGEEMASLTIRLEEMESRDNRRPVSYDIPKAVRAELEDMHNRLDDFGETVARMMRILKRQQAAIEELALGGDL